MKTDHGCKYISATVVRYNIINMCSTLLLVACVGLHVDTTTRSVRFVCCSDVESVVEEIRRDAVSRRCHVNHKEVESLALMLSQLSRSMATLKSMTQSFSLLPYHLLYVVSYNSVSGVIS